jgi:hypothetical protein
MAGLTVRGAAAVQPIVAGAASEDALVAAIITHGGRAASSWWLDHVRLAARGN